MTTPPSTASTTTAEEAAEERVARGVARYADGDVRGAAALWREAVEAAPEDERVRAYLSWAESRLVADERLASAAAGQPSGPAGPSSVSLNGNWLDDSIDMRVVREEHSPSAEAMAAPVVPGDQWGDDRGGPSLHDQPVAADRSGPLAAKAALRTRRNDAPDDDSSTTRPRLAPVVAAAGTPSPEIDTRGVPLAAGDVAGESPIGPPDPEVSAAAPPPVGRDVVTGGADAPVRRFLARAPTRPDLPPLDVPVLDERALSSLAASAGGRLGQGQGAFASAPPAPVTSSAPPQSEPDSDEINVYLRAAANALAAGAIEAAFLAAERAIAVGGLDSASIRHDMATLVGVYEKCLGDRRRIVRAVAGAAVPDARAAFLLSRVDGTFSLEDLVDVSGMSTLEATRLVTLLLRDGALAAA